MPDEVPQVQQAAAPPEPDAGEPGPPPGLAANKILKEPFRHPTRHYIILPKGTLLSPDMVEAITLMGAERQALACLGELAADTPFVPDILADAPKTIQKIDAETRVVRNARDLLALFLGMLAVFAFAARILLILVLMILAFVGWAVLGVIAYRARSRVTALVEEMDQARTRRQKGEARLQEAALKAGCQDRSAKP